MTPDQFFAKLEQTPRVWELRSDGRIRAGQHCPISAVAGDVYGSRVYEQAAAAIGLSRWAAAYIADAADRPSVCDHDKLLRDRLLSACGLAEPAPAPGETP